MIGQARFDGGTVHLFPAAGSGDLAALTARREPLAVGLVRPRCSTGGAFRKCSFGEFRDTDSATSRRLGRGGYFDTVSATLFRDSGGRVKRTLDISASAFFLILALPSLLIAALVIRLTSPGPVLFRQLRMGRDFKPFEILKLRTMAYGAPGLAYTMGADPRITRFGAFLRRSKLDEVPQLWNVLRGEMSLVGPRPVLPELTKEFRHEYALLLRVRPGLTDPASLKYSQEAQLLGTVKDPMGFFKSVVTPDKLAISMRYLDRASLWTDGVTLAMTAAICCFPALGSISQVLLDPGGGPGLVWNPDLKQRVQPVAMPSHPRMALRSRVLEFPRAQSSRAVGGSRWNLASVRAMSAGSTTKSSRERVSLL